MKRLLYFILFLLVFLIGGYFLTSKVDVNPSHQIGDPVDSLNHVIVYYNGPVSNVEERNTVEGYNVGLKWQCVEFVKRYYLEHYQHKMPDSYGHAKDFFNNAIVDGELNPQRDLIQYTNPSKSIPTIGDLIIMDATLGNPYGHVAIIANVTENEVEIIQQNPGQFGSSRATFKLSIEDNQWKIEHKRVLGWLRMKS